VSLVDRAIVGAEPSGGYSRILARILYSGTITSVLPKSMTAPVPLLSSTRHGVSEQFTKSPSLPCGSLFSHSHSTI